MIYLELGMSIFAIFDYLLHFFLAETKCAFTLCVSCVSCASSVVCVVCVVCVVSMAVNSHTRAPEKQNQAHHGPARPLRPHRRLPRPDRARHRYTSPPGVSVQDGPCLTAHTAHRAISLRIPVLAVPAGAAGFATARQLRIRASRVALPRIGALHGTYSHCFRVRVSCVVSCRVMCAVRPCADLSSSSLLSSWRKRRGCSRLRWPLCASCSSWPASCGSLRTRTKTLRACSTPSSTPATSSLSYAKLPPLDPVSCAVRAEWSVASLCTDHIDGGLR